MAEVDDYDYNLIKDHLEPFVNPLKNKPFIDEMEDNYGSLWQFKEHISIWTFGLNKYKNFVCLRYRA